MIDVRENRVRERVELHIHTNMSTMDGLSTVGDYIKAAIEQEMPAIAITDHASLRSFPDAYKIMKQNDLDFILKLIYGNEIYFVDDYIDGSHKGATMHATILVIDKIGLKNLYNLVSLANTKYFYKVPRTPKSEIERYRDGLLIGSGCDCGELYHAILDGKSDTELLSIASFYDYLEVVPTSNFRYYIDCGYVNNDEDLTNINKKIIEIGDIAGKPVVAVSDAHYVDKEDSVCRKILMCYKGFEEYNKQPDLSMKSTSKMLNEFQYLGVDKAHEIVIDNPNKIADRVSGLFSPIDTDINYEAEIMELVDLTYEKLHEKYGEDIPQECLDRIDVELSKIGRNKTSIYNLLLGYKVSEKARESGRIIGNRGLVASSYVAYLLGITEINPLGAHYHCPKCHSVEFHDEYNCGADMEDKECCCGAKFEKEGFTIPCETFLGIDGSRDIDIDFNFAPNYQSEVLDTLDHIIDADIIRCGTRGNVAIKTAYEMINKYSKAEGIEFDEMVANKLANKISVVDRVTGIHPGGVFVIPKGKDVLDYTPVQYPADRAECGILTTHFDTYSLFGLLKIDILGHDMLAMIEQLEVLTKVNAEDIPLDDQETYNLFNSLNTKGVPEFSLPFVRKILMPCVDEFTFDKLIRVSGISHGTGVWDENGCALIYGGRNIDEIVSCRDDVMLHLVSRGIERNVAYSISERIRKGKGLSSEIRDDLLDSGIEKWRLDSWDKIKYSFPRAHSAVYALSSYRIAYYKTHFPLEFYCAYFTAYVDDFDADLLINNAQKLETEITKLCENMTSWNSYRKLEMMEVCQEMYDKGYSFVSDNIKNVRFESFFIENGMLRPRIKN